MTEGKVNIKQHRAEKWRCVALMFRERLVSDIAFEYGFNSKENLTRVFKTKHNVLPTEYKSAGNSLKLFDRLHLTVHP